MKKKKTLLSAEIINDATFNNYLHRFEKICRSIFEWVNLPSSMDARWLEKTLYEQGRATILYDELYGGYINTQCSTSRKY